MSEEPRGGGVRGVGDEHAAELPGAPGLLSQRADPPPLPPPVHDAEEVASLHLKWARLSSGQGPGTEGAGPADEATGGVTGSVRAKVRARVVAAARADAAADRALIGDLVRAVDAVARRVDEVAARVGNLELLVQEMLDRLSEDLVRLQAALGTLDDVHGEDAGTRADTGAGAGPGDVA